MGNLTILRHKLAPFVVRLSLFLVLTLIMLWGVGVGQASSTIVVNSTADIKKGNDGLCTLREAIIAANADKQSGGKRGECSAGNGADTIVLPAGNYTLTRGDSGQEDAAQTGDLDIDGDLNIEGESDVTIDAAGITDRVFHVLGGNVTITGVTIQNGGGNVRNGGGIYNNGNLTVERVTLSDNVARRRGGGIYNAQAGTLTVVNSTVSGNDVISDDDDDNSSGGGIHNAGTLTLNNSTVSGNAVIGGGDDDDADNDNGSGGIHNAGTLTLNNCTVANNAAAAYGGVVNSGGGTLLFQNTIIADNNPRDCSGTLTSQGHNLVRVTTGCTIIGDVSENIIGQDPLLGLLQNNGGKTETHALLLGSSAIDAGNDASCEATDQRGEIRPLDGDGDGQPQCDMGAFELRQSNFVLIQVYPTGDGTTTVKGLLRNAPNTTVNNLYLSHTPSCDAVGEQFGEQIVVTTDENGYFTAIVEDTVPDPLDPANLGADPVFLTATATDPEGNPLGFSNCASIGQNVAWPLALSLDGPLSDSLTAESTLSTAEIEQFIGRLGQSRWYKFSVEPDSTVIVTLTDLPANYDVTVFKDIGQAFAALQAPANPELEDLVHLDAEFAPEIFSSDSFSPEIFSPDSYSPEIFSPEIFSPEIFSPEIFSPEIFSPDSLSPEIFSPEIFSPEIFSPEIFSPEIFSPEIFSGAQTRSLLAVSAFDGTTSEGVRVNSWNNTGEFYVRVRGRNGAFSLESPFRLGVTRQGGNCSGIPSLTPVSQQAPVAPTGSHETLILIDTYRMQNFMEDSDPPGARATLLDTNGGPLAQLAQKVDGVVWDVNQDSRVHDANVVADDNPTCPYAKNLVAQAIKDIVDADRAQNPDLKYVMLIGGDEIFPFSRYDDRAHLGPESQYYPPVKDFTASQASLRKNYVLSQDTYGSKLDISLNNSTYPVPGLGVGRLVETAEEINGMIGTFVNGTNDQGMPAAPTRALVTGYDFLADAANAVQAELQDGCSGCIVDALIDARDVPPVNGWTADQLRAKLLLDPGRLDLVYLAGHFSASGTLAADYSTRMVSTELINSAVDLENAIVYSAGCHAGYNIVNQHGVPIVTREPDWAQAFAQKGATLVAGTGYQYGDTDFLEYSERLYLEFTRQLRAGLPVGLALNEAKRIYLSQTPVLRGLHEKALLEAAVFGFPMLKVQLTAGDPPPAPTPATIDLQGFDTEPGKTLGLQYAEVTVTSPLIEHTVTLSSVVEYDPNATVTVEASYLEGNDGSVTNAAEPALPLEVRDVSVPGTAVRGEGLWFAAFQEKEVFPLVGAPTTELRGVHVPFVTEYYHPVKTYRVNRFDALDDAVNGKTLLMVTPAQHIISESLTEPQRSIRRQYGDTTLRLYFSSNFESYAGSTPALASAPAIVQVWAVPDPDTGVVTFNARVVGNPAAGVQQVWVTFTDLGVDCPAGGATFCTWQSLDLEQNPAESTLWSGELDLAAQGISDAANLRYIIQAVNGVGLINQADNVGRGFVPGVFGDPASTQLQFLPGMPTEGRFGTTATFSAQLTGCGDQCEDKRVIFRLGPVGRLAKTDSDGIASAELALLAVPDTYEVRAYFGGTAEFASTFAILPGFEILKQDTNISLEPDYVSAAPGETDTGIVATLTDATGRALRERSMFFVVSNENAVHNVHEITNLFGQAPLGPLPPTLDPGIYEVHAYFAGDGVDETLDLVIGDQVETLNLEDVAYNTSSAAGTLILNNPPVAVDDAYSVAEDTTLTVEAPGVLGNDQDPDDQTLEAILVGGPDNGTFTLNADGSFTYSPNADFNGIDSFAYKANDGIDDSNVTLVTITVNPVNDAPHADDQAATTEEDTPVGVTLTATDVDDDPLAFGIVTPPAHGILSGTAPELTYTPDLNYFGPDSFTFVANDGTTDSDIATVSILVEPINDAPVANDDDYNTDQDTTLSVPAPGVLDNDDDVEDDPLTAILVVNASDGYVILNADGSFTYTPDDGFFGTDSFTYKAHDGEDDSGVATVTITVNQANAPPVCEGAYASPSTIWSPDKDFHPVSVLGVTDPDGDPVIIDIQVIYQDEAVGKKKSFPDAHVIVGGDGNETAELRAEREGRGDGRIYTVRFIASDGRGGFCSGEVQAGIVPHDQSGDLDALDSGPPWFNSETGEEFNPNDY